MKKFRNFRLLNFTKRKCHLFAAKDEFSRLRDKWMIRRTKALIADQLPKKDERVVYCKPTPFQVS